MYLAWRSKDCRRWIDTCRGWFCFPITIAGSQLTSPIKHAHCACCHRRLSHTYGKHPQYSCPLLATSITCVVVGAEIASPVNRNSVSVLIVAHPERIIFCISPIMIHYHSTIRWFEMIDKRIYSRNRRIVHRRAYTYKHIVGSHWCLDNINEMLLWKRL